MEGPWAPDWTQACQAVVTAAADIGVLWTSRGEVTAERQGGLEITRTSVKVELRLADLAISFCTPTLLFCCVG